MNLPVVLIGLFIPSFAAHLEVPIIVEEPIGVARVNAPVTGGICLPPGQYKPNSAFSLWDGSQEVPVQVTPLVIDRKGYLRWILLDFQASLDTGAKKVFTLRDRAPAAVSPTRLTIAETERTITVNTGPLVVEIRRSGSFELFSTVMAFGRQVLGGGPVTWVDARTNTVCRAGPPSRVEWEYRGSLRATLRIQGVFEGDGDARAQYITRMTFWAGKTTLRVQHILANSNPEQVYHVKIRRASLSLRHQLGAKAEVLMLGLIRPVTLDGTGEAWIHQGKLGRVYGQPIEDAAKGGVGEKILWQGAESDGWIAVSDGQATIWLCDRDFAGDPPRRISVSPETIDIEYISTKYPGERGAPFRSDSLWLYDLSHRTLELWLDFSSVQLLDTKTCSDRALAARERLLAFAPGNWYARCDVLGVGPFGTLEDEMAVYRRWGWEFTDKQLPLSRPQPKLFIRWEDNHYESEADSPEALLLMALRTEQRGYFDLAEAWARYHANVHAWRTDGWTYNDGAIWFPQGGPLGTRPVRKPANVEYKKWGQGSPDDAELWHLVQAKACYCHFYGAGLVDMFLITGEHDYLEAAIDLAEQKCSEFIKHKQFTPGKTTINDTRGFGRGFYVLTHLAEIVTDQPWLDDLVRLCRNVLWRCPNLDERGFVPCHIGTGFGGFDPKRDLPPQMRALMDARGITLDEKGWLSDTAGNRWPIVCLGGTWQHFYVHAAAERYARVFNDEDMADFTVAFGRFAAKYLLSQKCKQTHYYAYMDIPEKGRAWDPWEFVPPHTETKDGEGCEHSGWYTGFFPDAMAKAYSFVGDLSLLERAREFWHYGSKRGYRTLRLSANWNQVGEFANHRPPKDDSVLSTARMFYEWAHLRQDRLPPEAVTDLSVAIVNGTTALVRFTAPADYGSGRVARYQLKCSPLPIVDDVDFDFARDDGIRRSFWRAVNCQGEPPPGAPGSREEFMVAIPSELATASRLYWVLVSYDDASNRSALSNIVGTKVEK